MGGLCQFAGLAVVQITYVSADIRDACDDHRMSDSRILLQNQMLFHLEAASAYAEELRDDHSLEMIENAIREVERLSKTSDQTVE